MIPSPPPFAVVIPAYNEEATIATIVSKVLKYADRVIVVNDGSTDNTLQEVHNLPITVLNNSPNMGKGASLCRGAQQAVRTGAHNIITLDADGQHRPEDIPLLLSKASAHPGHIIIGARTRERRSAPTMRRFANRFADFWVSWASGYPIRDTQSGFRLYPAAVFSDPQTNHNGFAFESEILITAAQRGIFSVNVDIDTIYGKNSRPSHYRAVADTATIVRMVAWQLIRHGLYPLGLLRSLRLAPRRARHT